MSPESENTQPDDDEASLISWERKNIVSDATEDEIETMWEIPQICHFLHETKEALNLPEISIYEVERMLLMPKASKQLAAIMTCLLCSPTMKTKLRKLPSMPYQFWTSMLMQKCKNWFKIYENKHHDAIKVLEATGLEPMFWKIFTDFSEIEKTNFEHYTLKQKVWLLKSLCDTILHNRKTIQEEIVKNSEDKQNDMILGTDRYGNTFFYLNQFADNELRVYKHNMVNKVFSTVKFPTILTTEETELVKKATNNVNVNLSDNANDSLNSEFEKTESTTKTATKSDKHRRKRGWKNGILPRIKKKTKVRKNMAVANMKNGGDNGCPTDDSQCSSNVSFCNDASTGTHDDTTVIKSVVDSLVLKIEDDQKARKENSDEISIDDPSDPIALLLKNTECSLVCLKKSKVTTERNEKITKLKTGLDGNVKNKLNETAIENEMKMEMKMETEAEDDECKINFWYISQSFLSCESGCETFLDENKLYHDFFSKLDVERNNDYWKENRDNLKMEKLLEDIDASTFELVADSVESLRDFIVIFATEHRNRFEKKDMHKVACEHKLLKKLCLLAEELDDKEEILKEATITARQKLCRELKNFQNGLEEESSWLGENGNILNWWIIGSQSANSANSQDSQCNATNSKREKDIENECDSSSGNNPSTSNNCDKKDEKDEDEKSNSDEEEQQPTRVLRARGAASYTGHFYMDDSDEDAPRDNSPDMNSNTSSNNFHNVQNVNMELSQYRKSDSESEEDSDGEWLLPGSKRKKKKRGRRFKNLQQRVHVVPMNNMMGDQANYSNDPYGQYHSASSSYMHDHEVDVKPDISKINLNLNYGNSSLKKELERVDSIHSELDIPEEKPVIDPVTGAIKAPTAPAIVQPRRPNNVPVVSSNVLIARPLQFPPQYRSPIRQPMMVPRSQIVYPQGYNQAYNTRPQPVYYRPQSYRNALPGVDSYMMHPRTSQQPMQMPQPNVTRPRLQMRMPRAPMTRYRAVQVQQNPRMRALLPASRAPLNPRIPQVPQPRRMLRPPAPSAAPKSTSLIVLSDSDDEIEMTVIEKGNAKSGPTAAKPVKAQPRNQKPAATPQDVVNSVKSILPSQVVQRINQGGISITPVKKNQPKATQNKTNPQSGLTTNPQLVVVVNETGSHYALALPNGSKLILTPEQVAQIRASNGGNLSV